MKTRIAALALLFLASASTAAMAQEDRGSGPRGRERGERPMRSDGEEREAAPRAIRQLPPIERPQTITQDSRGEREPRVREFRRDGPRSDRRPEGRRRGDDRARDFVQPDRADRADRPQRDRRGDGRIERGAPQAPPSTERRGPQIRSYGGDGRWRETAPSIRDGGRDGGALRSRDREHDRRYRPQWRPGDYPRSFRSSHRFHIRPYVRPPRFFEHVWLWGEILPPAWFGPEYVIDNWWDFDLPPPPLGYVWVRVGADALLVDDYSGRIVQVIRYMFW